MLAPLMLFAAIAFCALSVGFIAMDINRLVSSASPARPPHNKGYEGGVAETPSPRWPTHYYTHALLFLLWESFFLLAIPLAITLPVACKKGLAPILGIYSWGLWVILSWAYLKKHKVNTWVKSGESTCT